MRGKKGVTTIWMAIAVTLTAAVAIALIVFFVTNLIQTQALGQTEYLVNDLVSVMDTVGAAPGEVEISYIPPLDDMGYPRIGTLLIEPTKGRIGVATQSEDEMWKLIVNRVLTAWGVGAVIRTVAELRTGFDIGGVQRLGYSHVGGRQGVQYHNLMVGQSVQVGDEVLQGGEFVGLVVADKGYGRNIRTAMTEDPVALRRFLADSADGGTKASTNWVMELTSRGLGSEAKVLLESAEAVELRDARAAFFDTGGDPDSFARLQDATADFNVKAQELDAKLQKKYDKAKVPVDERAGFKSNPSRFIHDTEILAKNPGLLDQLVLEAGDGPITSIVVGPDLIDPDDPAKTGPRRVMNSMLDDIIVDSPQGRGFKNALIRQNTVLGNLDESRRLAVVLDGANARIAKRLGDEADRFNKRNQRLQRANKRSHGLFRNVAVGAGGEVADDGWRKFPRSISKAFDSRPVRAVGFVSTGIYKVSKGTGKVLVKTATGSVKTIKYVATAPVRLVKWGVKSSIRLTVFLVVKAPIKVAAATVRYTYKALVRVGLANGMLAEFVERSIKANLRAVREFLISASAEAASNAGCVSFPLACPAIKVLNKIFQIGLLVLGLALDFFFTLMPMWLSIDAGHAASIDQLNDINWKSYAPVEDDLVVGPPNCRPDYARENFDVSHIIPGDQDAIPVPILLSPKAKTWGTMMIENDAPVCMHVEEDGVIDEDTSCTGDNIKTASRFYEDQIETTGNADEYTVLLKELFEEENLRFVEDCTCLNVDNDGEIHESLTVAGTTNLPGECSDTQEYFLAEDVGLGFLDFGSVQATDRSLATQTLIHDVPLLGDVKIPVSVPSDHETGSIITVTAPLMVCIGVGLLDFGLVTGVIFSLGCEFAVYLIYVQAYLSPHTEQWDMVTDAVGAGILDLSDAPVIGSLGNLADIDNLPIPGDSEVFDWDTRTTPFIINLFTGSNFLDKDSQYYMEFPYEVRFTRECSTQDLDGDGVEDFDENNCQMVVRKVA